jgi:hypothetical protein
MVCGVQTIPGQSFECDYRAEAQAAMRWAVAATCERERLGWVRIALAWQDLDRRHEDPAIPIAPMFSLRLAGN